MLELLITEGIIQSVSSSPEKRNSRSGGNGRYGQTPKKQQSGKPSLREVDSGKDSGDCSVPL